MARTASETPNNLVNLSVRPVTPLANDASAAPVRPAGYAGRWAVTRREVSLSLGMGVTFMKTSGGLHDFRCGA